MVGKEKETLEAQFSFNDSVLQNSDLSLLENLQSLQNESRSVSEASNPPMTCTFIAGLINTLTSTTTVLVSSRKNSSLEQIMMGVCRVLFVRMLCLILVMKY